MPDTFERVLWIPGPSAQQSFVNIPGDYRPHFFDPLVGS